MKCPVNIKEKGIYDKHCKINGDLFSHRTIEQYVDITMI